MTTLHLPGSQNWGPSWSRCSPSTSLSPVVGAWEGEGEGLKGQACNSREGPGPTGPGWEGNIVPGEQCLLQGLVIPCCLSGPPEPKPFWLMNRSLSRAIIPPWAPFKKVIYDSVKMGLVGGDAQGGWLQEESAATFLKFVLKMHTILFFKSVITHLQETSKIQNKVTYSPTIYYSSFFK